MSTIAISTYKDSEESPQCGSIASLPTVHRKLSLDARERRRRGIINAVAIRYNVLIDPDLLDALIDLSRDPVEAIGEVIGNMRDDEIVLNISHFEVR